MFIHDWKKEVFTIPNILSLFRLALIPVYVTIYLHAVFPKDYYLSGSILAVSCFTDMIDGKVARRFHMQSTLGIILDPVADKLTQLTLTLCLSIQYPVLRYLLFLLVIKESFQCIVGLTHLCKGEMLSGALPAGKVCTTVFFISLIVLVLMPDLNAEIVTAIAITDGAFLSYAFVRYFFAYFGRNTTMQRLDDKRL